jgi:hypothetical protein
MELAMAREDLLTSVQSSLTRTRDALAKSELRMDLPRLSGEAFAQRDTVRSNCAGLV